MNHELVIKELCELSQLDIDAIHAYEIALRQIDDKEIHAKIDEFRKDHLRHVEELNTLIRSYGGTPPKPTPDLKGLLIEGMTALQSMIGIKGALKAMEANEITTNKHYAEVLDKITEFPDASRQILQKNYSDEQRHLAYIRDALKSVS